MLDVEQQLADADDALSIELHYILHRKVKLKIYSLPELKKLF